MDDFIKEIEELRKIWVDRQSHCWRTLQSFIVAASAVSIVPYIMNNEKAHALNWMLYIFPLLGGFMGLTATWIFAAEYERFQRINDALKDRLNRHIFSEKQKRLAPWPLRAKIGNVTVWFLATCSIVLTILNSFALFRVFFASH